MHSCYKPWRKRHNLGLGSCHFLLACRPLTTGGTFSEIASPEVCRSAGSFLWHCPAPVPALPAALQAPCDLSTALQRKRKHPGDSVPVTCSQRMILEWGPGVFVSRERHHKVGWRKPFQSQVLRTRCPGSPSEGASVGLGVGDSSLF